MSTNISKLKRDELIKKISEIKAFLTQNASNLNLVQYMNELEKEIKGVKYGLVFEEHRESIDEILDTHTAVLEEQKELFLDNGGNLNFLIEGDNLPALKLLQKTHKGKIDVIYIDPPYNTGNKDFKYDDNFVDKEDGFKHSKWLSFMEKRLRIIKTLMSKNSYICISIDDKEQTNLKLLCDSTFGVDNFIACFPRRTKSSGKTTNKISSNHDYLLVYSKNYTIVSISGLEHIDKGFKNKDEFENTRGLYKLNQTLDYDSLQYGASLDYPIEINGEIFYAGSSYEKYLERQNGNYKRADWAWRWSKDLFNFGYKNGFIVVKKKKNGGARIYTKTYLNATIIKNGKDYEVDIVSRTKPLSTLEFTESTYSNDNAKKDLNKIFNNIAFDYPKPVALIEKMLRINPSNKITALDCFAGTGTTAQALLKLNEDGGNRKFILVTNNENNICRDVTYERIKRVIEKEGYKASLKYYKVGFVKIEKQLYYEYADSLLKHTRELVELENNINFVGNQKIAILLTDNEVESFANEIEKHKKCRKIYLGHNILLTNEQEELFKSKNIKWVIIPDYYYGELKG